MKSFEDIDEAARLLDVNLLSVEDWSGGIGQSQFFRIPDFAAAYALLQNKRPTFAMQYVITATELALQNSQESAPRGWCEDSYTQRQLDLAIRGLPMRFDKAVISVQALRALAKEKQEPLPPRPIVCCAFRFPELSELVQIATQDQRRQAQRRGLAIDEENARERVLQHLQGVTKQRRIFIDKLLNKAPSKSGRRTVEVSASYPTLRSFYKALKAYPSLHGRFLDEPRESMIPLRRRRDHVATAIEEEAVESGVVTRPPYGWDDPNSPVFPPEIAPSDPFAWIELESQRP